MTMSRREAAATKKPASKPGTKENAATTTLPDADKRAKAELRAKAALMPSVNAAIVLATYTKSQMGEQEVGALMGELSAGIEEVARGDMKRAEAMLYGQAHSLQAIFMNLAQLANTQEYLNQWEAYLRMALKAQSQCRMTLETLATIKNPPVLFARQANINNGGHQQVNNGTQAAAPRAHAANRSTEKTELLEENHGQRLDARAQSAAGGADPYLEALGAGHRAAHT